MKAFARWLVSVIAGLLLVAAVITLQAGFIHSKPVNCHKDGADIICDIRWDFYWSNPFKH